MVRWLILVCASVGVFFFFKQKTAYVMRISDWSSDVCSSDLIIVFGGGRVFHDVMGIVAVSHDIFALLHFDGDDRGHGLNALDIHLVQLLDPVENGDRKSVV